MSFPGIRAALAAGAMMCAGGCTPSTTGAIDTNVTGSIGRPSLMSTYGQALAPPAFYSFCSRDKNLCNTAGKSGPVVLTEERMRQLRNVNSSVNASVREVPDSVSEGAEDVWTVATNVGDCEDIAILKKKRLLGLGWPASSLLLTVVRPRFSDEGHTLLTVRTTGGDFVLDNLNNGVRPWTSTSYRYYARQSVARQGGWEFIKPAS